MGKVYILRGVPGAGKSTWVSENVDPHGGAQAVSADHYFMRGGEYLFDPSKLSEAHGQHVRR